MRTTSQIRSSLAAIASFEQVKRDDDDDKVSKQLSVPIVRRNDDEYRTRSESARVHMNLSNNRNNNNRNHPINALEASLSHMLAQWRKERARSNRSGNHDDGDGDGDCGVKKMTDSFALDVDRLEDEIDEMRIWDIILNQVSTRSDICASRALQSLLHKLHLHYNAFLHRIDTVMAQVRRRLEFDWTIESFHNKRESARTRIEKRLNELQTILDVESEQSDVLQEQLAASREELRRTMNTIDSMDGDGDNDNDNDGDPRIGMERMIYREREIWVQRLTSGMRLCNRCITNGTIWFKFIMDTNDIGIIVTLDQHTNHDDHDYIEILVNHEQLPSTQHRTHCMSTRNHNHYMILDLHDSHMKQGQWFICVNGMGMKRKRFTMEFRTCPCIDESQYMEQNDCLSKLVDEQTHQTKIASYIHQLDNVHNGKMNDMYDKMRGEGRYESRGVQATNGPNDEYIVDKMTKDDDAAAAISLSNSSSPLGSFQSILQLPAPNPQLLRRHSKRSIMKLLLHIYCDKYEADATTPGDGAGGLSLCEYIYDTYMHRYGLPKLAQHNLHELIHECKYRYMDDERIQIFGRITRILVPYMDEHVYLPIYIKTLYTMRQIIQSTPHSTFVFDDAQGYIWINKHIARQLCKHVLAHHHDRMQMYKRINTSLSFKRVGKRFSGDLFLSLIMEYWKCKVEENHNNLRRLYESNDTSNANRIDFTAFAIMLDSIMIPSQQSQSQSYQRISDEQVFLFFEQATLLSQTTNAVTCLGFMELAKKNDMMMMAHNDDGSSEGDVVQTDDQNGNDNESLSHVIQLWSKIKGIVQEQMRIVRHRKLGNYDELWSILTSFKSLLWSSASSTTVIQNQGFSSPKSGVQLMKSLLSGILACLKSAPRVTTLHNDDDDEHKIQVL